MSFVSPLYSTGIVAAPVAAAPAAVVVGEEDANDDSSGAIELELFAVGGAVVIGMMVGEGSGGVAMMAVAWTPFMMWYSFFSFWGGKESRVEDNRGQ